MRFQTRNMKPLFFFVTFFSAIAATAQTQDSTFKAADTSSKILNNVTVSAARRPVDVQPDKVVLNVDALPAAAGENALELLRRAPGVNVDGADNVSLGGKPGVAVWLDGKPTQLSAQDLASLLKSLPAANIKQVEVIANPSSKYDAAGNAGIINIKLKKALTDGFTGSLSGSYVQSRHARKNAAANLDWRKNKLALFFNGGLNDGLQFVTANNDRTTGNRNFTQRSLEKDAFDGASVRAGLDYSLNKKSTIGFLWMRNNRSSRMDNGSTTLIQTAGLPDTVIATRSVAPFTTKRNSYNGNYSYTGATTTYNLDADYTQFQSSVNNGIANELQSGAGTKLGWNGSQNNQQVNIRLYSAKADVSKTFGASLKAEAGLKFSTSRTANSLLVDGSNGAQWTADTGKTNFFRYREDIAAAYLSLRGSAEKLTWQLGLRGEHTNVNGRSTDLTKKETVGPDTAYLNLFPTLFLQYALSARHSLGFSANRRIDRPNYQDQNPFIYFLDALNTEQGNASLRPQFTTGAELSYTYNYATSVKLAYAKTTNYIEWLTYAVGKYTVNIPQNAGEKQMVSLSVSSPLRFGKRWSAYASLTPYYHYYHVLLSGFGATERQSGGSWGVNSYISNSLELGKGWKGSVSGWFNFQNRATIYVSKPLGSLDLGVQKNILSDKATLKLAVVDLLNTQKWEQTATTTGLQLHTYRKWESQNFTLGFSWRFGNNKVKKARERDGANEEGVGRIK